MRANVFLVLALAAASFGQSPTPPKANVPHTTAKTRAKGITPKPLSKEFRKDALLTKVAWDDLLESVSRGDSEITLRKYKEEAEKADARLKADEQTGGDLRTRHCILIYENQVLSYQIKVAQNRLIRSLGGSADEQPGGDDAYKKALDIGRVVDNLLSEGAYTNQCD